MKEIVICDVDGTISLKGDRGTFDFSKAHEDSCNHKIADLVRLLSNTFPIYIFTAREEMWRPQTQEFLEKFKIPYDAIIMRKNKDFRKDSIVKRELYETYIKDQYNVFCVLDDRDQVVRMWRDMGVTCLQVADGKF